MRRLLLLAILLLTLVNLYQVTPARAQEDPYNLTVANWTFEVEAAVKAPFFMDTIHLGTLDDGRDWLVVTMTATNTSGEEQELHSDKIQLRSGGEMIKQTGDESEGVAEELGATSIGGSFPRDIEAGTPFQIVQVFKVSPEAPSNTLVFDFSGKWEIPLDDLIAASNGNGSALTGGDSAAAPLAPWTMETASYRLDLIGAVVGSTFSGPFHLGSPESGYDWLIVTYRLTSTRDDDTEVKADNHRLLIGTDELKQATDETKSVSSELGISMLTLDLKPNEPVDVVQVFKVPGSATAYTFQLSARGKIFLNLTPVVALANSDGNTVIPGSSLDLAQVDPGAGANAAPTAEPTSAPVATNVPEPTAASEPSQEAVPTEVATSESGAQPVQSDPAVALTGRLGGPLSDVRTRFGEPSWTDAGLIGYNSVSLGGTDAILVVYHDPDETVSKISIVYLERPAIFDDSSAIDEAVSEVAPLDGVCEGGAAVGPSRATGVVQCESEALAQVFDATDLEQRGLVGDAGDYHYAIDPTADEYFEILVEAGIPFTATSAPTPTSMPTSTDEVPDESSFNASAEELAYAAEIMQQTQTMADSLERFAELTQDADITSFVSEEWLLAVAVELVIWQQTYQDALALVPPPKFAAAHAKYLEGLGYISQSADAFAYGVDNFDITSIEQAAVLMNLGNAAIAEAAEEIRAVTG